MTNTTTQTFNPSFSNPDDMPVYVSIHDKPKRAKGRPTTCKMSDEQKKKEQKQYLKNIMEIIMNIVF